MAYVVAEYLPTAPRARRDSATGILRIRHESCSQTLLVGGIVVWPRARSDVRAAGAVQTASTSWPRSAPTRLTRSRRWTTRALQQPAANFGDVRSCRRRCARRGALAHRRPRRRRLMDAEAKAQRHRPVGAGRKGNHGQGAAGRPRRTSPNGTRPTRPRAGRLHSTRCARRFAPTCTQDRMRTMRQAFCRLTEGARRRSSVMLDPPRQRLAAIGQHRRAAIRRARRFR